MHENLEAIWSFNVFLSERIFWCVFFFQKIRRIDFFQVNVLYFVFWQKSVFHSIVAPLMHHKFQRIRSNHWQNRIIIQILPEIIHHIVNQINRLKYWWHSNVMAIERLLSRLSLRNKHNNLNKHHKQPIRRSKWPLHKHHRPINTWIVRIGNH